MTSIRNDIFKEMYKFLYQLNEDFSKEMQIKTNIYTEIDKNGCFIFTFYTNFNKKIYDTRISFTLNEVLYSNSNLYEMLTYHMYNKAIELKRLIRETEIDEHK